MQNTNKTNEDLIGGALMDYHKGNYTEDIISHSSLGDTDTLPLPHLFRSLKDMPLLEQKALKLAQGHILDIGCGAGSHALYLQQKGYAVTGLDSSYGAIEVCKQRGLKQTVCSDILDYKKSGYDTLLLLMNGIGIAGELESIDLFLSHLASLLSKNGQIILDSSDIIYMFEEDNDGGYWLPGSAKYYGEVEFYLEYKNEKSKSFKWLYLDFNTLQRAANNNNLSCELVSEGNHYDYLARLSPIQTQNGLQNVSQRL